jgi:hypothetical protein
MGNPSLRLAVLLLLLTAVTASAAKEPAKKVRLFILAGQTNMKHIEPDEVFTPAIKEAFPDDEIVVTKYAQSSEPIRKWYKLWRPPPGEKPPAGPNGQSYTNLINRVKADMDGKGSPLSITFIWMHGEADGTEPGYGALYGPALEGLILQLQKDFGRRDIDVIIGRLSDHKKGDPEWMAVRKAHEDIATAYPRGAWVDTDDLNGKGDNITYSTPGYSDLAKRFADKAIEQIKSPKQPPDKRKKESPARPQ